MERVEVKKTALSLGADLDPYLLLDTGGACIQPQRGGLAKPRPAAWVRKVTPFSILQP